MWKDAETEFWWRWTRSGGYIPRSKCIECVSEIRQDPRYEKLIPLEKVEFVFRELINRVGQAEAARVSGIARSLVHEIHHGQKKSVRAETARKAISALAILRAEGRVRHRTDIKAGTAARGKPERQPQHRQEFYSLQDDAEAEYRRRRRAEGKQK